MKVFPIMTLLFGIFLGIGGWFCVAGKLPKRGEFDFGGFFMFLALADIVAMCVLGIIFVVLS